jgi:hypothetical protein
MIHNHVHLPSAINGTWASGSNDALSEQQGGSSMAPQPLKRMYALYLESDDDTDDEELLQGINDVLANIHSRFPAMNLPQYVKMLKEHGIFYLPTTTHFGSGFMWRRLVCWRVLCLPFTLVFLKLTRRIDVQRRGGREKGKRRHELTTRKIFMPRFLNNLNVSLHSLCIHSLILPLLHSKLVLSWL